MSWVCVGGVGSSPAFLRQGSRARRRANHGRGVGDSASAPSTTTQARRRGRLWIRGVARLDGARRPRHDHDRTKTFNPMAEGADHESLASAAPATGRDEPQAAPPQTHSVYTAHSNPGHAGRIRGTSSSLRARSAVERRTSPPSSSAEGRRRSSRGSPATIRWGELVLAARHGNEETFVLPRGFSRGFAAGGWLSQRQYRRDTEYAGVPHDPAPRTATASCKSPTRRHFDALEALEFGGCRSWR